MARDPSALMRGLILGATWLAWAAGGYAYALMHGPVRAWLSDSSMLVKLAVATWLVISASLLAIALMYLIRGLGSSRRPPRA